MSQNNIFHFTMGPVQGFVAQARRTRDLWAGSFLLSWLSGQAMAGVLRQGGEIVFPNVGTGENPVDPMLRAILHDGADAPYIGTIPNRFKATVPDEFDAGEVVKRVKRKWAGLAGEVYERFIRAVAPMGSSTETIWYRQVADFWEIVWVQGPEPARGGDNHWLDMRKNWRSHWPQPEGGDHCLIMGDFQEISGFCRGTERDKQDKFWQAVQAAAPDGRLDIRDNERLCAIAVIKRFFPRLGRDLLVKTIGWVPGGDEKKVGNWPSTTYMAVAPWLSYIAENPGRIGHLRQYVETVHDCVGMDFFKRLASEQATHLASLGPLKAHQVAGKRLDDIDGDLLHQHALENFRATYLSEKPVSAPGKDPEQKKRRKLLAALSKLYQAIGGEKGARRPRSYYALLLMDGDRLGKMLRDHDPGKVSAALMEFTSKVTECVEQAGHNGVTIYAGGDDVLALLPMPGAIACARQLNGIFVNCFREKGIPATASVAIVFAHHQVPLRTVMAEARHQLEDIAKDKNGRNSLALAVLKPQGVTASWVSCWEKDADRPVDALEELIAAMQHGGWPRGFFHKLRDRYGFYEDKALAGLPDGIDYSALLMAELMQSREKAPSLAEAEAAVDTFIRACRTLGTDSKGRALDLDGGFIARFLTQEED